MGWIIGKIVDRQGNVTPEMTLRAFLASVDNIPVIVGFKDLLEKFRINIDATKDEAFIETK